MIFDESSFFDGKRDQQPLLLSQQEVLDEETEEETDVEAVEDNADFEEEEAARSDDLDEEGDYRKAVELEYAYLPTPPPTQEEDLEAVFQSVFRLDLRGGKAPLEGLPDCLLSLLREAKEGIGPDTKEDQFLPYFDRFSDFYPMPIEDGSHGAFTAGQLFKPQLSARKKDHLALHEEMGSFEEVLKEKARGKQVLSSIAAEFDLELDQIDAVNAFVNCLLEEEEVVYMRLLPGFQQPGKVLRLRKALYGLRRSPLLWQ
ncbi:reverse transcriptase (RNA-dependent DNA polymerase) [Hirsutella rhossiliensis]|uniref:Reverse transcriptase (RNA-dependent DNA polymerase) domain-containing protein n=1 Tax=Hirsutella rhossiliensis TaxID=111463 RepID=A0A9P8MLB6_9HYPO|nr:reverse transcriptase (RNA-dependent DNA polymerase) domain-containing protein [Hirsutella rhossiliensis]KAH0957082.1 reverse transcriptase (RNA-dependent DNA polymerase) domain-containing protein [Hirsutella rhossiliensis]